LNTEFKFQSNGQFSFENNLKRTINCPVTRANMNEAGSTHVGAHCWRRTLRLGTPLRFVTTRFANLPWRCWWDFATG